MRDVLREERVLEDGSIVMKKLTCLPHTTSAIALVCSAFAFYF